MRDAQFHHFHPCAEVYTNAKWKILIFFLHDFVFSESSARAKLSFEYRQAVVHETQPTLSPNTNPVPNTIPKTIPNPYPNPKPTTNPYLKTRFKKVLKTEDF